MDDFLSTVQRWKSRRALIVRMRKAGKSLQEIADAMDPKVSRQAIHKILKKHYSVVDSGRQQA